MGKIVTQEEYDEVRAWAAAGLTPKEIFGKCRLSLKTISRIVAGTFRLKWERGVQQALPQTPCKEHGKPACVKCAADRHYRFGGKECAPHEEPDDPEMNERIRRITAAIRRSRGPDKEVPYTIPTIDTLDLPRHMLEGLNDGK